MQETMKVHVKKERENKINNLTQNIYVSLFTFCHGIKKRDNIRYVDKARHFKIFWRTSVLFVGPLIPLLWTSGDICPRFESQGGSLNFVPCHLREMDFLDSLLLQHLPSSWQPPWRPSHFWSTYLQAYLEALELFFS